MSKNQFTPTPLIIRVVCMEKIMRFVSILLLVFLLQFFPAYAGEVEDATSAIEKGDYATAFKLLQAAADRGEAQAQLYLGMMYLNKKAVEKKDSAKALEWINKAVEQNDAEAQVLLGNLYLEGADIPRDYNEALKWFHKAADQGFSAGQFMIGHMYSEGKGVAKDDVEAEKWYAKSRRPPELPAEFVDALAVVSSATLYSLQPYGGPDLPEWDFEGHHVLGRIDLKGDEAKKVIAAVNDAVADGQANAASMCLMMPRHALSVATAGSTYDFVICYECGQLSLRKNGQYVPFSGMIGRSPDALNAVLVNAGIPLADDAKALKQSYAAEAKEALKRATEGDRKAQEVIGKMYIIGRGIEKNKKEGIKWFVQSLGMPENDPEVAIKVAAFFEGSLEMMDARDKAEAFSWYRKAADQGNAKAQYEVGQAYEYGYGVEKSVEEAQKWYQKAADQGNADAQYELGIDYILKLRKDPAYKPDYAASMKWLLKAAKQGHGNAASKISGMYVSGEGVTKDILEAYFWDRAASELGTSDGNRMSPDLTPEQFSQVEKRLQDWLKLHTKKQRVKRSESSKGSE